MKFKSIRNLIYSPVLLVIGESTIYPMTITNISPYYDEFEVIGIRALNAGATNWEDAVVISLKEPAYITETLGKKYWEETKDLRNTSICEEGK